MCALIYPFIEWPKHTYHIIGLVRSTVQSAHRAAFCLAWTSLIGSVQFGHSIRNIILFQKWFNFCFYLGPEARTVYQLLRGHFAHRVGIKLASADAATCKASSIQILYQFKSDFKFLLMKIYAIDYFPTINTSFNFHTKNIICLILQNIEHFLLKLVEKLVGIKWWVKNGQLIQP